jgi:alpha-galactosidase
MKRAGVEASRGRLRLSGSGTTVDVGLTDGALSIARGRSIVLHAMTARAALEDGETFSSAGGPWELVGRPRRFEDAHGAGVRAMVHSAGGAMARLLLEVCVYDQQPFAMLRLALENASRNTPRVRSLALGTEGAGGLAFTSPAARWRWFRHGWQSWTPTLPISGGQQDIDVRPPVNAPVAPPRGRGELASEEVAALLDPATGQTLLLGFVTARRQWTQIRLHGRQRAVEALAFADGSPLRPAETMWSERLLVEIADDAALAFARYGDALGREMGARVPRETPAGWCSWYYFFTTVTEEDVLRNLRFLTEHRRELPVDLVQIDDGYQANIGDWTATNEKFPRGMAPLAREIKDAGFTPGIWLAPLLAGETSRLFAEHPEWMIGGEDGKPALAMRNWDQECYGLDCTNPRVERWLRDLFHKVTDDWGYEYVKIDFVYGGALAGRRHDKAASRIEAYRRGLEAIRSGVGERFVLGCGSLMGPSAGIVDAQRIGPDVAPWWRFRRSRMRRELGRPLIGGEPSTENAVRNILTRAWMHRRLWVNDPDCLMARTDRTKLTLPEVQSLATAIALSGGALFISDDMAHWPKSRLDLVSAMLPPLGDVPVVRDLLREPMPSTLEVDVRRPFESWRLVSRFNWSGRRALLRSELPPGRWHAFEFWDGRYYGVREGAIELEDVPAHGVRLLALRRDLGRPQLLGTTFHYSMGRCEIESARWNGRAREVRIGLLPVAKKRGEVFVSAPKGYWYVGADFAGKRIEPIRRRAGMLAFRLDVGEPGRLRVRFA